MKTRLALIALLLAALVSAGPYAAAEEPAPADPKAANPAAEAPADPTAWFGEFLAGLTVGEPIAADQVVVFPILAPERPKPVAVMPETVAQKITFAEIEKPKNPFDLSATNEEEKPVLVLGGTVLIGGRLDRMVPADLLVPVKNQVVVPALPAEYPAGRRSEPVPFLRGTSLAPEYLRERALFGNNSLVVPRFVSHFLEFRNPGDERNSLAAIDDSEVLAVYCVECHRATAEFPDVADGRVVGFATAVRGRLHDVELFGSNELLRAWFPAILRAHTYTAAAIEIRAKKVGFPLPKNEREQALLTAAAAKNLQDLLDELKGKAKLKEEENPKAALGTRLTVRVGQSRGQALGHEGRLLHAVIFPADPFEDALFSRAVEPPAGVSGDETSFGELERREERGTLTEFEKRLLDRMRNRR